LGGGRFTALKGEDITEKKLLVGKDCKERFEEKVYLLRDTIRRGFGGGGSKRKNNRMASGVAVLEEEGSGYIKGNRVSSSSFWTHLEPKGGDSRKAIGGGYNEGRIWVIHGQRSI